MIVPMLKVKLMTAIGMPRKHTAHRLYHGVKGMQKKLIGTLQMLNLSQIPVVVQMLKVKLMMAPEIPRKHIVHRLYHDVKCMQKMFTDTCHMLNLRLTIANSDHLIRYILLFEI